MTTPSLPLPVNIGRIHFTGIGGIGMSGIAEILADMGYQVQGSDIGENANVMRLRRKGIEVTIGHASENIRDAAIVVISTAIARDNAEVLEARRRGLPVVHRAEMLGELMRLKFSVAIAGTHGKTTTTSLVASLLDAGGVDATVINGGIMGDWGSNARLGKSDWMVVEADESDGSFARLTPTIAVVTNIDPEHLDHYGSFENLLAAFGNFIDSIPFYGFASVCIDHPVVASLTESIRTRRIITYGFATGADIRADNIAFDDAGMCFDVHISRRASVRDAGMIENLRLPMLGNHNVLNCLAAVSIAVSMGIGIDRIRHGLAAFKGVGRRFDFKGSAGGISVIDDYGHHPVEIKAVLAAARMMQPQGRIIAVMQPHRYSRLNDLFGDFCAAFDDADTVLIADVYAAGEAPLQGVTRDALVAGIGKHGHKHVMPLENPEALAGLVLETAKPGDIVICLGAGSSTAWAAELPGRMQTLLDQRRQA